MLNRVWSNKHSHIVKFLQLFGLEGNLAMLIEIYMFISFVPAHPFLRLCPTETQVHKNKWGKITLSTGHAQNRILWNHLKWGRSTCIGIKRCSRHIKWKKQVAEYIYFVNINNNCHIQNKMMIITELTMVFLQGETIY